MSSFHTKIRHNKPTLKIRSQGTLYRHLNSPNPISTVSNYHKHFYLFRYCVCFCSCYMKLSTTNVYRSHCNKVFIRKLLVVILHFAIIHKFGCLSFPTFIQAKHSYSYSVERKVHIQMVNNIFIMVT